MRFYSLILGISIILATQASELDAQSSVYFPIGIWCTDFLYDNDPLEVTLSERNLIRDLGITYLIACPEGYIKTQKIIEYTDDEMNAGNTLKANVEHRYDAPIALWATYGSDAEKYILQPADPDRIAWISGVESTIENMNTNYASRPGFADILILHEDTTSDSWPGYNFMAQVIDSIRDATGSNAQSIAVVWPTGSEFPDIIGALSDVDRFSVSYYPFTPGTPYGDQIPFDKYTEFWSEAITKITETNGTTGDMVFHPNIQAHADITISTGDTIRRFPTPEEFLASVNIALCYGAKGITYYLYDSRESDPDKRAFGLVSDANPRLPSGMYNTVKNVNDNYLSKISGEYLLLDWQSAFTSGETVPGGSVVTGISGASYIEIGNFTHQQSGESYFILVNRVASNSDGTPADPQTLTVTLETGAKRLIEDVLASREPWDENPNRVAYRILSDTETDFTVELKPGEGRLFRLSTAGLSGAVDEDRYWSGEVWVGGQYVISDGVKLEIYPGVTTKFSDNARLKVNGQIIANGTQADLHQEFIFTD